MRTPPDGITDASVVGQLAGGWSVVVDAIEYLPVGFGSHHWRVVDAEGEAPLGEFTFRGEPRKPGAPTSEVPEIESIAVPASTGAKGSSSGGEGQLSAGA